MWWLFVFFNGGYGFFSTIFLRPLVPDLLNPVAFSKTRAPQPRSPTSSAPSSESPGHAGRQSPTRGLHAPESSWLFGARDSHAPRFSGRARWGWGRRWPICGWVASVTARVGHAPPSPAVPAPASTTGSLILLLLSVCVVYFLVSSCTVCLCITQILLEF